MEKSNPTLHEPAPAAGQSSARPEPVKRRFGLWSTLVRIALAIVILAAAVWQVSGWVAERPEPPQRFARERTFTVEAMTPVYGDHASGITTYGQVAAAREIDIRAQVQGRVLEISPNLAIGNEVEEGEVLVRIDPFAYDGAVVAARAAIADAELSLAEAREAYGLEERNIAAAETTLAAAQSDLDRATQLLAAGSGTRQTVQERELTVAEREQALLVRQSNLLTLSAQIQRQQAAIAQAQYQLETAQRDRANTEILAPFTGVVTARNLTAGAHVNANEVVASLYETAALEVSFSVSDRDYASLRRDGLFGRTIHVASGGGAPVDGRIARVAPQIDSATGGVTLYGEIDGAGAQLLRPGTFVSVRIDGIAHENTLRVPETAIYDDDHLYVIRDGRMAAVPLTILDRDGSHVIVAADIPEGERIIATRLSQAGDGVAVIVEGEEPAMPQFGAGGPPMGGGMVMRGPGG